MTNCWAGWFVAWCGVACGVMIVSLPVGRLKDRLTRWLLGGGMGDRSVLCMIGWSIDRMIDWLTLWNTICKSSPSVNDYCCFFFFLLIINSQYNESLKVLNKDIILLFEMYIASSFRQSMYKRRHLCLTFHWCASRFCVLIFMVSFSTTIKQKLHQLF